MTGGPSREDDFTPEERLGLDAWDAPPPPPGLAADVLRKLDALESAPVRRSAMRRTRPQRAVAWGAIGLALAASLALWLWPRGQVFERRIDATERETAAIGERGVLVAEKDSQLHFRVEPDGATRVEQGRGDVFYRVEPGAAFVVVTPLGELTVTGTCLRVAMTEDTSETMNGNNAKSAMKAGRSVRELTGAALLGAAATSVLFVTVFEGRVDAATPSERGTIEAGQTATVRPDGTLVVVESGAAVEGRVPTAVAAPETPSAPDLALAPASPEVAAPPEAAPVVTPPPEPDAARAQREQLEAKVATLERELAKTRRLAEKVKTYDLQPETLQKMAQRCELRWDHPSIQVDREKTLDDETIKAAGITPDERLAIEEVFQRYNTETMAELRRLYTLVTGDDQVENLAAEAMLAEINDKSEPRDLRLTFERLSAERAGLQASPDPGVELPPVEQVYRLLTSVGDRIEKELADRIGADRARQMRDAHDGWGSASRSSYGCPKRTP